MIHYTLKTDKRTLSCRDLQSARSLYACRKHATIIKYNPYTQKEEIIAEK